MSGENWSELENDAIVTDYFAMLSNELAGKRYNQAVHNWDAPTGWSGLIVSA